MFVHFMKLKRLLSPYTLVLEGSQLSIYGFMAFDLFGLALQLLSKLFQILPSVTSARKVGSFM